MVTANAATIDWENGDRICKVLFLAWCQNESAAIPGCNHP